MNANLLVNKKGYVPTRWAWNLMILTNWRRGKEVPLGWRRGRYIWGLELACDAGKVPRYLLWLCPCIWIGSCGKAPDLNWDLSMNWSCIITCTVCTGVFSSKERLGNGPSPGKLPGWKLVHLIWVWFWVHRQSSTEGVLTHVMQGWTRGVKME